jgi:peptide deformylase
MPARTILQLGNPTLRQASCPVRSPEEAAPVLEDLRDTLHEFRRTHGFGRGISAIQIGLPLRIVYIEIDGASYSLLNPFLDTMSDEKIRLWDNCFSFPDLLVHLERSKTVTLHYQDEHGVAHTLEVSGAFSELLQHEIDHLDGILAIDRAIDRNAFCTKEEYERRFRGRE